MTAPTNDAQRAWILDRSRAMHSAMARAEVDEASRETVLEKHASDAVSAFRDDFGVGVDQSQMYFLLLTTAPGAEDPGYFPALMRDFLERWAPKGP